MRRSFHNLDHHHLLSTDMGLLVPVGTMEVLPGDTFNHAVASLVRVAPLVNPLMHPVDVRIHHWYAPNRILWSDFDDFIVGKDTDPVPTVTATSDREGILGHMGMAIGSGDSCSALPVRAYNAIYNEFYRDQDLQTARGVDDLDVARCCWEKDYLTTARDSPQQGDAVQIEFSAGTVPVTGLGVEANSAYHTNNIYDENGSLMSAPNGHWPISALAAVDSDKTNGYVSPVADMSQATGGIDVNDLRQAIALQRFAEARARYGSRYADYLRFLGINPSDGRLDRPEYLGGGRQSISFSEVLATAEGTNTDVGDMFGHGLAAMRTRRYRKMFEEHGWVISLMSVRPKTMYEDMVPRQFRRYDPMQYWQKELEVLPWQEVYQDEVHTDGDPATIFGYVPRYEEYRHAMSYVSGSFAGGTENDWHMARSFASVPTLNDSFVECTPTDRVYADTSMPELLINVRHELRAMRLVRGRAAL